MYIYLKQSKIWSLTPKTTILIESSCGGTERMTFLAPAFKCVPNCSLFLYTPVHSTTMSILFQVMFLMFFSEENEIEVPATIISFSE